MPEPTRRAHRPKNKNALLVAKTSLVALSVGLAVGGFGILAGSDAQTALQADALAAPDAPLSPAAAPTAIPQKWRIGTLVGVERSGSDRRIGRIRAAVIIEIPVEIPNATHWQNARAAECRRSVTSQISRMDSGAIPNVRNAD